MNDSHRMEELYKKFNSSTDYLLSTHCSAKSDFSNVFLVKKDGSAGSQYVVKKTHRNLPYRITNLLTSSKGTVILRFDGDVTTAGLYDLSYNLACEIQVDPQKSLVAINTSSVGCIAVWNDGLINLYKISADGSTVWFKSFHQEADVKKMLFYDREISDSSCNSLSCLLVVTSDHIKVIYYNENDQNEVVLAVSRCTDVSVFEQNLLVVHLDDNGNTVTGWCELCTKTNTSEVKCSVHYIDIPVLYDCVSFSNNGETMAFNCLGIEPYILILQVKDLLASPKCKLDTITHRTVSFSGCLLLDFKIRNRSDGSTFIIARLKGRNQKTIIQLRDVVTNETFQSLEIQDVCLCWSVSDITSKDVVVVLVATQSFEDLESGSSKIVSFEVPCPIFSSRLGLPGIGVEMSVGDYVSVAARTTNDNKQVDLGPMSVYLFLADIRVDFFFNGVFITYTPPLELANYLKACSAPSHHVVNSPNEKNGKRNIEQGISFKLSKSESKPVLRRLCAILFHLTNVFSCTDIQDIILSYMDPIQHFLQSTVVLTIFDRKLMTWGIIEPEGLNPWFDSKVLKMKSSHEFSPYKKDKQKITVSTMEDFNVGMKEFLDHVFDTTPPSTCIGRFPDMYTKLSEVCYTRPNHGLPERYPLNIQTRLRFLLDEFPVVNVNTAKGLQPLPPVLEWLKTSESKSSIRTYKKRDPLFTGIVLVVVDHRYAKFEQEVIDSGLPTIHPCDIPIYETACVADVVESYKVCVVTVAMFEAGTMSKLSGFKSCIVLLFSDMYKPRTEYMLPFVCFKSESHVPSVDSSIYQRPKSFKYVSVKEMQPIKTKTKSATFQTGLGSIPFTTLSSTIHEENVFTGLHKGQVSLQTCMERILEQEMNISKMWAKENNLSVIDLLEEGVLIGTTKCCVYTSPFKYLARIKTALNDKLAQTNIFKPCFAVLPQQYLNNHILVTIPSLPKCTTITSWFVEFVVNSSKYRNMLSQQQLEKICTKQIAFDCTDMSLSANLTYSASSSSITRVLKDEDFQSFVSPIGVENTQDLMKFLNSLYIYLQIGEETGIRIYEPYTGKEMVWGEFVETFKGRMGNFRLWDIHNHCQLLCRTKLGCNDCEELLSQFFQIYKDIDKSKYDNRRAALLKLKTVYSKMCKYILAFSAPFSSTLSAPELSVNISDS